MAGIIIKDNGTWKQSEKIFIRDSTAWKEVEQVYVKTDINTWNPILSTSSLPPKGKALNAYSWEEIAQISEAGKASEYFNIGDAKSISFLYNNKLALVDAKIIAFNHDSSNYYNKKDNGITFATIPTSFITSITYDNKNYTDSRIRSWLNENTANSFQNSLNRDSDKKLLDVVKRTYKTVNYQESNSNWARVSINDKFFLFSNAEIHGNDIYHKFTFSDEDTQYDFFKTDTNKIVNYYNEKGLDAGPSVWGLRSPYYGNTDSSISYNGINTVGSVIPISYRSSSMFVFGFCI